VIEKSAHQSVSRLAGAGRGRKKGLVKNFGVSAAVLFTLYYPIISVGYYQPDDLGRAILGYNDLTAAGRPLAALIIWILNAGPPLTDIAPASQYLSVIILSAAAAALASFFKLRSYFKVGILALSLGGNPYFFENMLFRFDSVTMSMAVFFAVWPILWIPIATDTRSVAVIGVLASASLLASLMLYQPAINAFMVFACFIALRALPFSLFRSFWLFGFCCVVFAFTCLLYSSFAFYMFEVSRADYALPTKMSSEYVMVHTQISEISRLPVAVWKNLVTAYVLLLSGWHATILGWIWGAIFLIAGIVTLSKIFATRHSALSKLCFCAFLAISMVFSVFAIQLPLVDPLLAARTFIGWGALLAVASIIISIFLKSKPAKIAVNLVFSAQLLATYSVGYSFANALNSQLDYDKQVMSEVVTHIRSSIQAQAADSISISGALGISEAAKPVLSKYHFARGIVYSNLREGSFWAAILFRWAGLDLLYRSLTHQQVENIVCFQNADQSGTLYSIYVTGKMILIKFHNGSVACR
jgi:hypothetical protein